MEPKFSLGQIVITPNALEFVFENNIQTVYYLGRHMTGDWGDMSADDKKTNDDALLSGERLFSSYDVKPGTIWIITEADRSATTILLPEDY